MRVVRTECAICGWNTPCHDDGEAYICVDSDMCKILQELNETREELKAAQAVVAAARLYRKRRQNDHSLDGVGVDVALEAYDAAVKGGGK